MQDEILFIPIRSMDAMDSEQVDQKVKCLIYSYVMDTLRQINGMDPSKGKWLTFRPMNISVWKIYYEVRWSLVHSYLISNYSIT